jgi:hypothetical protein
MEDYDSIMGFLKAAGLVLLGGVGVMVAGFFQSRSDNKRTRSDQQSDFTTSLIARIDALELMLREERKRCDDQLDKIQDRTDRLEKYISEHHVKVK